MTAVSGQYYHSFDGDVLDRIAWKHYGYATPEILKMIYDANVGLSAHGPVLPEGLNIFLPDVPPAPRKEAMRLW